MTNDPFNLARFVDAQAASYAQALSDFGQAMAKAEAASAKKSASKRPDRK